MKKEINIWQSLKTETYQQLAAWNSSFFLSCIVG